MSYTVDPELLRAMRGNNPIATRQLFLYDFKQRSYRPLLDSPVSVLGMTPVLWAHGDETILVLGALEPVAEANPEDKVLRQTSRAVLSINTLTGRVQRLLTLNPSTLKISAAQWDERASVLRMSIQGTTGPSSTIAYKWEANSLTPIAKDRALPPPHVSLYLRQDVNHRPTLWEHEIARRRDRQLLDPNEWLDIFKLGHVEHVSWPVGGGHTWQGDLYYPPAYDAGKQYPLLLQTHGGGGLVSADGFSLTGVSNNYAAQPTAVLLYWWLRRIFSKKKLRLMSGPPFKPVMRERSTI
jgi:hypothetical protein